MSRILVKYQTLNRKSDNLSFKVFFLFFANFSLLTAVKHNYVIRCMRMRLGGSEAISAYFPQVCVPFLHAGHLFNLETVWNNRRIKFNPPPEVAKLTNRPINLTLKPNWATAIKMPGRNFKTRFKQYKKFYYKFSKAMQCTKNTATFSKYWEWMKVPGDLNTRTKLY